MGSDGIEILFQKRRLKRIVRPLDRIISVFGIKFLWHHYPFSATKSHRAVAALLDRIKGYGTKLFIHRQMGLSMDYCYCKNLLENAYTHIYEAGCGMGCTRIASRKLLQA